MCRWDGHFAFLFTEFVSCQPLGFFTYKVGWVPGSWFPLFEIKTQFHLKRTVAGNCLQNAEFWYQWVLESAEVFCIAADIEAHICSFSCLSSWTLACGTVILLVLKTISLKWTFDCVISVSGSASRAQRSCISADRDRDQQHLKCSRLLVWIYIFVHALSPSLPGSVFTFMVLNT